MTATGPTTDQRSVPAHPGGGHAQWTAGFLLAAMLLVAAVLINVGQFRDIDKTVPDQFAAGYRADTADFVELAYRQCAWCRQRFGPHLALGVVAPGSQVIVPASSPYAARRGLAEEFTLRLYTFGAAARVDWVAFDQGAGVLATGDAGGTASGLDPTPYIVASGPGGAKGAPWALAVENPDAVAGATADPDRYLQRALQAGRHRAAASHPRQFVVLRWPAPRNGFDHQDLLLETSLLPDEIREELTR